MRKEECIFYIPPERNDNINPVCLAALMDSITENCTDGKNPENCYYYIKYCRDV